MSDNNTTFTTTELTQISEQRNAVSRFDSKLQSWLRAVSNTVASRLNEDIATYFVEYAHDFAKNELEDLAAVVIGMHNFYFEIDHTDGEVSAEIDDSCTQHRVYVPENLLRREPVDVGIQLVAMIEAWHEAPDEEDENDE